MKTSRYPTKYLEEKKTKKSKGTDRKINTNKDNKWGWKKKAPKTEKSGSGVTQRESEFESGSSREEGHVNATQALVSDLVNSLQQESIYKLIGQWLLSITIMILKIIWKIMTMMFLYPRKYTSSDKKQKSRRDNRLHPVYILGSTIGVNR